jgi:uncharacterized membrane protein YdfJ with MMPL/SSD domain
MFDWLARLAYMRSRLLVVAAAIFLVVGGALGGSVFGVLKPFGFDDPASEAIQTRDSLGAAAGYEPSPGLVALVEPGRPARSPAARREIAGVARTMAADPMVVRVGTPFRGGSPDQISTDGDSAYVVGFFKAGIQDDEAQDAAIRVGDRLDARFTDVTLGGIATAYQQVGTTVENDLRRAEMLAFPILFLISFWVFRSMVAAALPLMIGGLAIVGALVGLRIAAEATDLSIFAVNLVTAMGLGLAIDYSLFMVSRYREELARRGVDSDAPASRLQRWEALRATMHTAGRTVVFSSLTVAAAMASLLVFPQRFLYSMGVGGTLVALFSAVVAITVLPAILALLGHRVNALTPKRLQRHADADARPSTSGFWYRLSRFVMRRPVAIAMAAAAVLIVAGLPFLRIEFTSADAGILPTDQSARIVDDALKSDFSPGRTDPTIVEAQTGNIPAATQLAHRISRIDGVADVGRPMPIDGRTTRIDVYNEGKWDSDSSLDVVSDIRALHSGFPLRVTGSAAFFADRKTSLADHLPVMLAIVVTTTFIVLFLMTGSVVLPIKTLLMNFLTISATFGAMVFVFQDGRLEGLLGYTSQGAIDTSMPLLLFAVAFGLSTDYGVFLLTRIKEARDNGASNDDAVAIGLERTGRIVTAAALLLAIALGALMTSQIIFLKENGFGNAFAVLVDAFIVRALLVPSLMKLLGRWNWWAPRPLRRLHERIGLSHA